MLITVSIKNCSQCRFVGHSGGFTVRGARTICVHSDACQARRSKKAFKKEYPEYRTDIYEDWDYHWYHRIVDATGKIVEWCPLKHGSAY